MAARRASWDRISNKVSWSDLPRLSATPEQNWHPGLPFDSFLLARQNVLRPSGVVHLGWVSVLVARRLWRVAHPRVRAVVSTPQHKALRPLKPRTPHDCPVCGRAHPTPLVGNARQPGGSPWQDRKSKRGRPKTIRTAGYACPNPECDYFGNADSTFRALVGDGIQWLKCQACRKRFSSQLDTALHRLRTPAAQIALTLLVIHLGLSIADAALLFHHSEVTLRLWLSRAGQHAQQVHAHFFRNLSLGQVQLDELP